MQEQEQQEQLSISDQFLKWFRSRRPKSLHQQHNRFRRHHYFTEGKICESCFLDLSLEEMVNDMDDFLYGMRLRWAHVNNRCFVCAFILLL
jgi:hypothetical protein